PLMRSADCMPISPSLTTLAFFFYCSAAHLDLHSFPTRPLFRSPVEIRSIARLNGRPATTFSAIKAKGYSDVSTDNGIQAELAKIDRKSTRLNSSHQIISYAVFCLKKKTITTIYTHKQSPITPEY